MRTKKILVADDHAMFRQGLVKIIESDSLFKVVAEADDGLDALKKIKKENPDVAILDISMPNMSGLQIAKKIKEENIKIKIIILTMHTGQNYFQEALDYNVKGYVLKENTAQDLISALRCVISGKSFISPLLSDYLLEKNDLEENPLNSLSPNEKRIFKLISENKTSEKIGIELHLSTKTIQNHRTHICAKLGLSGWNALLTYAIENKSKL